jgi:hypothetical protein
MLLFFLLLFFPVTIPFAFIIILPLSFSVMILSVIIPCYNFLPIIMLYFSPLFYFPHYYTSLYSYIFPCYFVWLHPN